MKHEEILKFILNWEHYNEESFIEFFEDLIDINEYEKFLKEKNLIAYNKDKVFIHDYIEVYPTMKGIIFNKDNYILNLTLFSEFIEKNPELLDYLIKL